MCQTPGVSLNWPLVGLLQAPSLWIQNLCPKADHQYNWFVRTSTDRGLRPTNARLREAGAVGPGRAQERSWRLVDNNFGDDDIQWQMHCIMVNNLGGLSSLGSIAWFSIAESVCEWAFCVLDIRLLRRVGSKYSYIRVRQLVSLR